MKGACENNMQWDAEWDPALRVLADHDYDIDEQGHWSDLAQARGHFEAARRILELKAVREWHSIEAATATNVAPQPRRVRL